MIDNVYVNNACSYGNIFHFEGDTSHFEGHMINRNLYSWSFNMKFMKLPKGLFHKLHMKWALIQDPLYIFSYEIHDFNYERDIW